MPPKLPDFITEPGILVDPSNPHFSVGKVWKENAGRRRTATIKEIHTIGFDQMPPVVLDVTAAEGEGRFTKSVRIAGWRTFLSKWSPVTQPTSGYAVW